jgi:hypothetical protein
MNMQFFPISTDWLTGKVRHAHVYRFSLRPLNAQDLCSKHGLVNGDILITVLQELTIEHLHG